MPTHRLSQFSLKNLMRAVTAVGVGCGTLAFATRAMNPEGWQLIVAVAMIGAGAALIGLGADILLSHAWHGLVGFAVMIVITFIAFRFLG
jgi:hypothetical protein